jgi:hypothetical protein
MSVLRDRIMGSKVPQVPQSASTVKDYGAPTEIPLVRVSVYTNGVGYDEPIIAPDGGLYMPTGRGQWGQLYAVGR